MSKGKILFQLSGSIACFKACAAISRLAQEGYELEVVATRHALEFVGRATLEGLTGRAVRSETFAPGQYMDHIHLMKWADCVVLYPATANTMAKLAAGIGDDLLTTLFLAHDFNKPYLVAPAMNTLMYRHPATGEAMRKLRGWGVEILEPNAGHLACGDVGEGRLIEPEALIQVLRGRIGAQHATDKSQPLRARVLVTAGGTREAIDGVRSIANLSTGKTGTVIADAFAKAGCDVTLLRAAGATPVDSMAAIKQFEFSSYADLENLLRGKLQTENFDVVIHAAAVSDFTVFEIEADGKISKPDEGVKLESSNEMTLRLKRTAKLVDQIKAWSKNSAVTLVAFKLTNSADLDARASAVEKLNAHAAADFVVQNDVHDINPANQKQNEKHLARIFNHANELIATTSLKAELARVLLKLVLSHTSDAEVNA